MSRARPLEGTLAIWLLCACSGPSAGEAPPPAKVDAPAPPTPKGSTTETVLTNLKLEGSSSEFTRPSEGNVYVPLTAKKPGLYLIEASAGQHRATTLLFVSDTIALTKVSGSQMLVWSAQRSNGAAVPGAKVVWTDGVGVLKSGSTDAQGLVTLDRPSPEQTYVFGVDPAGEAIVVR